MQPIMDVSHIITKTITLLSHDQLQSSLNTRINDITSPILHKRSSYTLLQVFLMSRCNYLLFQLRDTLDHNVNNESSFMVKRMNVVLTLLSELNLPS